MPHFNEVPIRPRSGGGPLATLLFFLLMEEAVTQRRRTEREQQQLTTLMVAPNTINIPISAPRAGTGVEEPEQEPHFKMAATKASTEAESTVFKRFYSDVQDSILDPVRVASLLRQEGIAAESLTDKVSSENHITPLEKAASIMRHVEAAIRVNRQSFWAFLAVLEQSGPPACDVAQKMKGAVELHKLGETVRLILCDWSNNFSF